MEDTHLDVHSWLVAITFMVVIALVIHPVRIPLPIPAITHAAKRRIQERRDRQDQLPLESEDTLTTSPASASASAPSKKQKRPRKYYPHGIVLNLASAPVLGVLFLLATTSIKIQSVRDGIVGAPGTGVEPYAVMVLFMSLAYICISLDMTGIFQYAAFWIAQRANGSGQRVFFSFFILSTLMSGLASNDVVVLTMTPFLIYFAGAVNLDQPVAFLMAEFQTANIASMALYIGNPTNVVASQAYKISFLEYSAWMLLPCFACVIACYAMLRIVFRDQQYVPLKINSPGIDPRTCLIDPKGAIFGLCVLASSLICLVGTSFAHVSVWIVTGPFALLSLCRDAWYDWQGKFLGVGSRREISQGTCPPQQQQEAADLERGSGAKKDGVGDAFSVTEREAEILELPELMTEPPPSRATVTDLSYILTSEADDPEDLEDRLSVGSTRSPKAGPSVSGSDQEKCSTPESEGQSVNSPTASPVHPPQTMGADTFARQHSATTTDRQMLKDKGWFERRWPLLHAIFVRMPWPILPFTFGMFILVEGLSHTGWIGLFATWFSYLVPSYVAAVYSIGLLSVVLCNLFNNIPMTILVARILQHSNFMDVLSSQVATSNDKEAIVRGCVFALIVGSNLGACTTFIASLAGLMWDTVLRNKGRNLGFWTFAKWNAAVMPLVILTGLSVLVAELTVMYY
ncbi:hypothetical protein DFQ27_005451 [Actinomortierella ambigua]|uniref:Citrate transporter-like domain-containing protein n=1 Tax=Actinomortierella ambigua TaxID=1343610 RepID=A0A9P6UB73_9FUNG|nr:hypothetical protein DFQ27_005451 [Actinomortierella ambigua]